MSSVFKILLALLVVVLLSKGWGNSEKDNENSYKAGYEKGVDDGYDEGYDDCKNGIRRQ